MFHLEWEPIQHKPSDLNIPGTQCAFNEIPYFIIVHVIEAELKQVKSFCYFLSDSCFSSEWRTNNINCRWPGVNWSSLSLLDRVFDSISYSSFTQAIYNHLEIFLDLKLSQNIIVLVLSIWILETNKVVYEYPVQPEVDCIIFLLGLILKQPRLALVFLVLDSWEDQVKHVFVIIRAMLIMVCFDIFAEFCILLDFLLDESPWVNAF